MIFRNAEKKIVTAPQGSDPLSGERLSLLIEYLKLPKKGLAAVEILGESGKSSCAAMLSHALCARGYRVGTLSTPFSHTVRECIALNGQPISMDEFTHCVSRVTEAVTDIERTLTALPALSDEEKEELSGIEKRLHAYREKADTFSLFADELLLSAALCCFSENGCHLALIEIPNGERMGAYRLPLPILISAITTTVTPSVSKAICNRLDRQTREIVSAVQEREIARMISDRSAKINCRLTVPLKNQFYIADLNLSRSVVYYKTVRYELNSGAFYQARNVLLILELLSALKRQGLAVDPEAADLQPLFGTIGLPLQFSFLSFCPNILTDCADTAARRETLAESLSYHKDAIHAPITLVCEDLDADDDQLRHPFEKRDLAVCEIKRVHRETAMRDMKPIAKALRPDDTLVILGTRAFVYEAHRALLGLLP